jgi:amino acid efflux transporter
MTMTSANQPAGPQNLTTSRGAALYIGAILGPGLLLLPGLAAAEAGPASILAWLGLLGLSGLFAAVFSALGRRIPSAGGVMGYVTAGLGSRAGRATGWMFLAGVVGGAPIVCLIGASYVTDLTGGGLLARAAVAAALLLTVIALAAGGLRASAAAQLVLVGLLTAVVVVAVAGSATAARAGNWAPFAPHGWLSVGHAAATLMFSFVGWEAVAPLTTRFADPSRQLPRAVAIALAFTTALYLALAVTTIGVLGPRAATDVPLAALLTRAVGTAGPDVAAVAAIVLTLGATNAYISGAAAVAGQLARAVPGRHRPAPRLRLLAAIAVAGLLLITAYGLRIVSAAALVAVPTALFLTVYLGAMTAALRVLRGPARLAAWPGALAVLAMLGFSGWALALPAVIALACCRPGQLWRRPGQLWRRPGQLWRPVMATVTPTPIMASPPAPPTISTRRGDRANQFRTALAANPQEQSEIAPMNTETSARTSICSGTCPAPRLTNCGRIAPNRMYALGLVRPTTAPSRTARHPSRGGAATAMASASDLRWRIAWMPSQTRYSAPTIFTIANASADRCSSVPSPTATNAATT